MKYKTVILASIITVSIVFSVSSQTIQLFGKEQYGFEQPKYLNKTEEDTNIIKIKALADADMFPVSSELQGSVFTKIFNSNTNRTGVTLNLIYKPSEYQETLRNFEIGTYLKDENINAVFGDYYKKVKYSHAQYIYPAFFDNNFHIITSRTNEIAVKSKEDLKKYKGARISKDKITEIVEREFNTLEIKEYDDYYKAYEALLTNEVDYLIASYYPATIEAYKMGIKNYISFSKSPVWKIPMFIKVYAPLKRRLDKVEFEKFLRGNVYQKTREQALNELIEIYKEKTRGVVPPTFIKKSEASDEAQENAQKE